jgi:hypothetical protein
MSQGGSERVRVPVKQSLKESIKIYMYLQQKITKSSLNKLPYIYMKELIPKMQIGTKI